MPENLYEILGVTKLATPTQIKAAYRRLVLLRHPDQAGEDADVSAFIEVTKAYEVLSDPARRAEYDRMLALRNVPIPKPGQKAPPSAQREREPTRVTERDLRTQLAKDLSQLIRMYGKGLYSDAEKLARQIVEVDPAQATPYAILGDLARARGDLNEAAKLYAFAVQMDPRNPMYQRKHEELLGKIHPHTIRGERLHEGSGLSAAVSFGLVLAGAAYVALAQEPAMMKGYAWINTWTFGLLVMLFLSGVAVGAGLSLAGYVDRFESLSSNALNRVSPALALASIAIVNFWAAALVYALVGAKERTHTYSISRLIIGVGGALAVICVGASGSHVIDPLQVLLWGGNLIYVGAICGWMVADTLGD